MTTNFVALLRMLMLHYLKLCETKKKKIKFDNFRDTAINAIEEPTSVDDTCHTHGFIPFEDVAIWPLPFSFMMCKKKVKQLV